MSESNVLPLFGAPRARPTAVVYCEGNFGRIDGKTANGLVRHSDRYDIVSVIDSTTAGVDAGTVLDEEPLGIPVHADLDETIAGLGSVPTTSSWASLRRAVSSPTTQRAVVLDAMSRGMHVVNGLHEFLNDDAEFAAAAAFHEVEIADVRRPKDKRDLRMFTGEIHDVTCPRIAVLGTDGAIGKRTTATDADQGAQRSRASGPSWSPPARPGLIQGAKYGVALDAIPAQFCAGELEGAVVAAFEAERPDVIIVEGQGALSHPTYMSSTFVLRGACPAGVVLQHAPGRSVLSDFPLGPDAHAGERDPPHRDLRRHEGDRAHDQPREHDRRRGVGGDRALRSVRWVCRPPMRSPARRTGSCRWCCRRSPGCRRSSPSSSGERTRRRARPRQDRRQRRRRWSTCSVDPASRSPGSPRPCSACPSWRARSSTPARPASPTPASRTSNACGRPASTPRSCSSDRRCSVRSTGSSGPPT